MIGIQQAILSLYSEAQFAGPANNGGYDDIRWHVKPDGITKEKVQTELDRLNAEWTAQAYARNRQAEYPDWGTQLEKIDDNGLTRWREEMIDPIKSKWPKDNSGPK